MGLAVNGMLCTPLRAAIYRAVKRASPHAEFVIARADGRVSSQLPQTRQLYLIISLASCGPFIRKFGDLKF